MSKTPYAPPDGTRLTVLKKPPREGAVFQVSGDGGATWAPVKPMDFNEPKRVRPGTRFPVSSSSLRALREVKAREKWFTAPKTHTHGHAYGVLMVLGQLGFSAVSACVSGVLVGAAGAGAGK